MSQKRTIDKYFTQRSPGKESRAPAARDAPESTLLDSSSPLSSCPPVPSPKFSSPLVRRGVSNRNRTDDTVNGHDTEPDEEDNGSGSRADHPGSSFISSSFPTSSQRVMKNGKPVVTNSDSDNDSDSSLESPEALLARFTRPKNEKDGQSVNDSVSPGSRERPVPTELPTYKFSIEDLVVHAVDDTEMRANVTKAREALNRSASASEQPPRDTGSDDGKNCRAVRHDVLTSVIDDSGDVTAIQRLRNAVERTEALDRGKSWAFFDSNVPPPSPVKFPAGSIPPGFWADMLREAGPRERAFCSGIVGEALASGDLPEELIFWLLHALTVESNDELLHAYCGTLKLVPAAKISKLVDPSHIDQIFRRLSTKSDALTPSEVVRPSDSGLELKQTRSYRHLLSVLDAITGLGDKLNHTTREHTLKILLRLILDEECMIDGSVCVATQEAITSLMEGSGDPLSDLALYEISIGIFKTIQQPILQSQLLKQLVPTTRQIALFRLRLALSFLYQEPSSLDKPIEHLLDIKRIISQLDDPRFNVNLGSEQDTTSNAKTKAKSHKPRKPDYWSFAASTLILNAAIDSGTAIDTPTLTSDKEATDNFNHDVDKLAKRVKSMFVHIQDSGASHLKRAEAKENLQALYYRLIFAVRTKERRKRPLFVSSGEGQNNTLYSYDFAKESREEPAEDT